MKKLILILLAILVLTACGQDKENTQEAVYVNITAQEAKKIMDTQQNYIILDTRTQAEYDEKHIPGAIVISHDEIKEKAEYDDRSLSQYINIVLKQHIKEIEEKNKS